MRNKRAESLVEGSTAMLYAFCVHLTWRARISRVGSHLWWDRIRRHGTKMEWVGGGKFPAPGQFIPEGGALNFRRETWEGWGYGKRVFLCLFPTFKTRAAVNWRCRDLACALCPPWPASLSIYPSFLLPFRYLMFQTVVIVPCNTSITGPGKFCFENHFSYKSFLLAIQIPSYTWRKRMFP